MPQIHTEAVMCRFALHVLCRRLWCIMESDELNMDKNGTEIPTYAKQCVYVGISAFSGF